MDEDDDDDEEVEGEDEDDGDDVVFCGISALPERLQGPGTVRDTAMQKKMQRKENCNA